MKNFEAGSFLKTKDYTKASNLDLYVTLGFCLVVLTGFIIQLAI